MTPDTAIFLLGILNGIPVNVGADDFEQAAAQIVQAKKELKAIIAAAPSNYLPEAAPAPSGAVTPPLAAVPLA